MTQECLDSINLSKKGDTFKIDNALLYLILSKIFMDMDAYVHMKQRKNAQDSWALFFNIHKQVQSPDHVARQAIKAEWNLQNSHYDSEKKGWDWNKYVAFYKEQHMVIKSLIDYGYSGMDISTEHFLQGINSTELETAVNIVWAKLKMHVVF